MQKKSSLNNPLLLLLGVWLEKLWFRILEHFFVYLTVLAPSDKAKSLFIYLFIPFLGFLH